jgi:hypothetical protein
VIAPVLPHDHVYNASGSVHTHQCACGEAYEADGATCVVCLADNKPFPWWLICIVEALVFGGVIVVLLRKRKETAAQPEIVEVTQDAEPAAAEVGAEE